MDADTDPRRPAIVTALVVGTVVTVVLFVVQLALLVGPASWRAISHSTFRAGWWGGGLLVVVLGCLVAVVGRGLVKVVRGDGGSDAVLAGVHVPATCGLVVVPLQAVSAAVSGYGHGWLWLCLGAAVVYLVVVVVAIRATPWCRPRGWFRQEAAWRTAHLPEPEGDPA